MIRWVVAPLALVLASPAPPVTQPSAGAQAEAPVKALTYDVIGRYPHDPKAFTQGLIFRDGVLYESTGREGQSTIRRVRISDGKVLQSTALPMDQFGEGLTDWGNELVSITWQHGVGYRWNLRNLRLSKRFAYPGEGWGLTHNGQNFYFSDGSPDIRILDPMDFRRVGQIRVTMNGSALPNLNELEWIKGRIYANIWQSSFIVAIDPKTGKVDGVMDLSPLKAEVADRTQGIDYVANGIAYDAVRKIIYVTGKNWPTMFALRLKD